MAWSYSNPQIGQYFDTWSGSVTWSLWSFWLQYVYGSNKFDTLTFPLAYDFHFLTADSRVFQKTRHVVAAPWQEDEKRREKTADWRLFCYSHLSVTNPLHPFIGSCQKICRLNIYVKNPYFCERKILVHREESHEPLWWSLHWLWNAQYNEFKESVDYICRTLSTWNSCKYFVELNKGKTRLNTV